jgi:HK97 family phage prohead protease
MTPEIKSFSAQTKVLNEVAGLVEAVFSVTNLIDRGNDIIHPGAFTKAIASSRLPTVVFSHQVEDINQVLGKTTSRKELLPGDPELPFKLRNANLGGVKANLKFDLETPAGRLGFTHVKNDNLKEWSFAYTVADGGAEYEQVKGENGAYAPPIRHLKDINEVLDITLCVVGMNQATSTVAWKSGSRPATSGIADWMLYGAAQAVIDIAKASARKDYRGSTAPRSNPGPGSWLSSLSRGATLSSLVDADE